MGHFGILDQYVTSEGILFFCPKSANLKNNPIHFFNGTQIDLYGISNSAAIQLETLIVNFVKIAIFLKSFFHFKNFKSVDEIFQKFCLRKYFLNIFLKNQ